MDAGEKSNEEGAAAEGPVLPGLDQLEDRIGEVLTLLETLREENEALRSQQERVQEQIDMSQRQLRHLENENQTLRSVQAEAKRRVEALLAKLRLLE